MSPIAGAVLISCFLLGAGLVPDLLQPVSAAVPATYDFSPYPECAKNESLEKKNVPKLASQFTIKVEGKTTDKDNKFEFFDSEGYYEAEGQRGATILYQDGKKTTYLYDFITGKAYDISYQTCQQQRLYPSGCNAYAIFIAELAGHSTAVADQCQFVGGPVNYLGDKETIRTIPVREWSQCVYDHKTRTLSISRYYYNKDNVTTPFGSANTPIRFENVVINGSSADQNKTFTYDFTYYVPTVEDEAVFLPESGTFCPNWTREVKAMPKLADQFTLNLLTVAQSAKEVHSLRMNFDYKKQLVTFITDSQSATRFPVTGNKSRSVYRSVHDYKSGLAFTSPFEPFSISRKSCNITIIDGSTMDSRTSTTSNTSAIHIRHANGLFGLNTDGWVYIGQKEFKDTDCDVWACLQPNVSGKSILVEAYWMQGKWTSNGEPVLYGMIQYESNLTNKKENETYTTVVSDYTSVPMPQRVFEVDSCLRTSHPIVLTFSLRVPDASNATTRSVAFTGALREALSLEMAISPLRLPDFTIRKPSDSQQQLQVYVTILEWVNVTARALPASVAQKDSREAVDALLKKVAANDLDLKINFNGQNQTVTILKNSTTGGADVTKPTVVPGPTSTTPSHSDAGSTVAPAGSPAAAAAAAAPAAVQDSGYTGGSMAGLAIAMILIGGVAGLVAGFLLWKRNTGIAYQVYD